MFSRRIATLTAASLIFVSSAAVAQSAAPLSLSNASPVHRAGASTEAASDLNRRRGAGIYIIGAIVLGLIIWGIIELTKHDDPDSP